MFLKYFVTSDEAKTVPFVFVTDPDFYILCANSFNFGSVTLIFSATDENDTWLVYLSIMALCIVSIGMTCLFFSFVVSIV